MSDLALAAAASSVPHDATPLWPSEWTAIGTVAVAVVAVAVALFAEYRAGKRVASERAHAATVLADERKDAAALLQRQLDQSDRQRQEDREHGQCQQQEAQAWAVAVMLSIVYLEQEPETAGARSLSDTEVCFVAEVLNYGERTIGQIRARLFTDGDEPAGQIQPAYVPREPQSPHSPIADTLMQGPGVLPPGAGMRFTTEIMTVSLLKHPRAEVRWRDHRGGSWQNERGEVRKLTEPELIW